MLNIMLCGAGDVSELMPPFKECANEMGFLAQNFTDGTIKYHQYGENKWKKNSKMTIDDADILVFVINERYGEITWNTEMETAVSIGKNFIVLCRDETFNSYRFFKDQRLEYPPNLDEHKRNLYILLDRLEHIDQITVVSFGIFEFKQRVKEQLLQLFKRGIGLAELKNQKDSFIPILMSSKYNNLLPEYINDRNEKICRDILFDFFENKETRKRALEYFKYSKTLTDAELSELAIDMEQGVKRKTITMLPELIHPRNNLEYLFEEIITNISNDDDIGMIRRSIKTFINLDLELSIKYFGLFLPANDVGTPKRIIAHFKEKEPELDALIGVRPDLVAPFIGLVRSCMDYNSDKTSWKSIAHEFIAKYEVVP